MKTAYVEQPPTLVDLYAGPPFRGSHSEVDIESVLPSKDADPLSSKGNPTTRSGRTSLGTVSAEHFEPTGHGIHVFRINSANESLRSALSLQSAGR